MMMYEGLCFARWSMTLMSNAPFGCLASFHFSAFCFNLCQLEYLKDFRVTMKGRGRVSIALGSWGRGLKKANSKILVFPLLISVCASVRCSIVCLGAFVSLSSLHKLKLSTCPMPSALCCHLTWEWQSRVLTPYYENMRSKAPPRMTDTSSLPDPCHFSSIRTTTIGSMLQTRTL